MRTWNLLILFCLYAFSTMAGAQDRCSDILRDGTLQNVNWREKSYFNELVYARFASLTYEAATKDKSLTGSVSIADYVLGGSHNENSFREKKQEIENTFFRNVATGRDLAVVISKGDPEIVGAWSKCMASNGGGLIVQPRVIGPRQVRLDIQYLLKGAEHKVTLSEDVLLTNADNLVNGEFVTILQGGACLKKGAEYSAGAPPCPVTLRIASAQEPLSVVATSTNSVAEVYIPPRLRLMEEIVLFPKLPPCPAPSGPGKVGFPQRVNEWQQACTHGLIGDVHRGSLTVSNMVSMPSDLKAQGWKFLPGTARVEKSAIYGDAHRGNSCAVDVLSVTDESFRYGIILNSPSQANASIVCLGAPSIMMRRVVLKDAG